MATGCVGHLGKRTESDFFKLYSQGATREEAASSSRKKKKRKKEGEMIIDKEEHDNDEEKEPEGEEEGEKNDRVTRSLPSNETRTTN